MLTRIARGERICDPGRCVIYVTFERTVRRRPEIVWQFLTDVHASTAWVEELVEVRLVDDDEKLGAGTRLAVERRAPGKIERVTCEITAWREPSLIAVETRLPGALLLDRITLTPVAEGTTLGVFAERIYGGMPARAPGLAPPTSQEVAIRGAYERSIDALVTRIERDTALPYR
jgi:uncharacterized protein YndB with AHSA1/START domain